ncbi:MAG: Hpt domain-containing protein [Pseudomonadota bacterium]
MLESATPATEELDPAVRALLPNYIRRRESDVEMMAVLLGRRDYKEVGKLAHNMRGSGTAYGFPRITELGGQIEHAAMTSDTETLERLAGELGEFVATMRP